MTPSNIEKLKHASHALWLIREALDEVCMRTSMGGRDDEALFYVNRARTNADRALLDINTALTCGGIKHD